LQALPTLYGGVPAVLERARRVLPGLPAITKALDELASLAAAFPDAPVGIDLADARGFHYHTGVFFAVYCEGWPNAVIRGGRFNDVGKVYGRARPATGFSLDLRELAGLLEPAQPSKAIRAPWGLEASLQDAVRALRKTGEIVVQVFPDQHNEHQEFECDRELVLNEQGWQVQPIQ